MSHRILGGITALMLLGAPVCLAQTFEVLVTQTPAGPTDLTNPANWGGVLQYTFANTGAAATAGGNSIPASSVEDPAGLAYSTVSQELLVGNRRGNTGSASINRFAHTTPGGTFTGNGSFSTTGLVGAHQLAISPANSELFVGTVNDGVYRFTQAGFTHSANGSVLDNVPVRGVAISPDGNRLYATTASNVIRQWDLVANTELTSLTVPGASSLHYLRFRGNGELYAADFGGDQIFRFSVASNNLTNTGSFSSTDAISLAFSPDQTEMFVSTHSTSTVIHRYLLDPNTNNWTFQSDIAVGQSMGDIFVIPVPEPTTIALLAAPALLLLRRRR